MIPYFLLYFFLALKSLEETSLKNIFKKSSQQILIVFFSIFIGLRVEVGCDWYQYIRLFDTIKSSLAEAFDVLKLEPTFIFLNSMFGPLQNGYILVNFVCGIIFSYCLIKFCATLPRPWLALCTAYPNLILVVSMGYTRQSVAIALALLAFVALENGKFYRSILLIIFGSTFHRVGLFYLFAPLLYTFQIGSQFNKSIRILLTIPIGYIFVDQLIIKQISSYQFSYLELNATSSGAYVRVILLLIPSIIFLGYLNKFKLSKIYKSIFFVMAIISFVALILLLTSFSSTAVDRIALNLLPIQLVVASYLPDTGILKINKSIWKIFMILSILPIMSVWLIYAVHSYCWIPYKNILISSY